MTKIEIELEANGKITIPKKFREELTLNKGDKMSIEIMRMPDGKPYFFVYPHKRRLVNQL